LTSRATRYRQFF